MEYTPCMMMDGVAVVILASGKGLRLRPLSLDRPKTLCPVCNQPLLARLLKQLQAAGIQRATLTLPDAGQDFVELVRRCEPNSLKLDICFGVFTGSFTAALAPFGWPPDSLMVIYGDSLLSLDFADFISFHREVAARGGLATIAYHRPTDLTLPEKDGRTYHGVMSTNAEGRVTEFVEKPRVDVIPRIAIERYSGFRTRWKRPRSRAVVTEWQLATQFGSGFRGPWVLRIIFSHHQRTPPRGSSTATPFSPPCLRCAASRSRPGRIAIRAISPGRP